MTGRQLKEKRSAAGLTQEQAAQTAGVTWSTWQRWESRATLPQEIEIKAIAAINRSLNQSLEA